MHGFEWDESKAIANLRKHKVAFADAAISLYDLRAFTVEDADSIDEKRFVTMAMAPNGQVLVTVYTYAGDNIRIISSRRAGPAERNIYMAG